MIIGLTVFSVKRLPPGLSGVLRWTGCGLQWRWQRGEYRHRCAIVGSSAAKMTGQDGVQRRRCSGQMQRATNHRCATYGQTWLCDGFDVFIDKLARNMSSATRPMKPVPTAMFSRWCDTLQSAQCQSMVDAVGLIVKMYGCLQAFKVVDHGGGEDGGHFRPNPDSTVVEQQPPARSIPDLSHPKSGRVFALRP